MTFNSLTNGYSNHRTSHDRKIVGRHRQQHPLIVLTATTQNCQSTKTSNCLPAASTYEVLLVKVECVQRQSNATCHN